MSFGTCKSATRLYFRVRCLSGNPLQGLPLRTKSITRMVMIWWDLDSVLHVRLFLPWHLLCVYIERFPRSYIRNSKTPKLFSANTSLIWSRFRQADGAVFCHIDMTRNLPSSHIYMFRWSMPYRYNIDVRASLGQICENCIYLTLVRVVLISHRLNIGHQSRPRFASQ